MLRRLSLVLLMALAPLAVPAAAHADARVTVANPGGAAAVDPAYATTLRVSGSGFQAVRGGHGGIYVFFGTVKPGWQPSRGGVTGSDYLYVPDTETEDNQGFQRYVAFPGSDTAGSANGGVMSASGSWSTELVVPGAVFRAYDREGDVRQVDCRTVTCGIITVGAHGIANAHNETFTPVAVRDLGGATPGSGSGSGSGSDSGAAPGAGSAGSGGASTAPTARAPRPARAGAATLEVDRPSAVAGRVLAFAAAGLTPGSQVSAIFDDGAAAAGPFAVGPDGRLAGILTLPVTTGAGTHELRLHGVPDPPAVRFAVRPAETVTDPGEEGLVSSGRDDGRDGWLFAGASALVLVLALGRLGTGWVRRRRAG